MRHDVEHAMEIFIRLGFDCGNDFRMTMTDIEDTNTADPVQETIPIQIFDDRAFGTTHRHRIATVDCTGNSRLTTGNHRSRFRARQRLGQDFR